MASSVELMEQLARLAKEVSEQAKREQNFKNDFEEDTFEQPEQSAKTEGKSGF